MFTCDRGQGWRRRRKKNQKAPFWFISGIYIYIYTACLCMYVYKYMCLCMCVCVCAMSTNSLMSICLNV